MRIISKFSDYYDSARAYGEDPDLVYLRHTRDIEASKEVTKKLKGLLRWFPSSLSKGVRYREVSSSVGIIGFCGELYPVWYICGQWVATGDAFLRALNNFEVDIKGNPVTPTYGTAFEEHVRIRRKLIADFWPDKEAEQALFIKEAQKPLRQHAWRQSFNHGALTKPKIDACRERPVFKDHTDLFTELDIPVFFFRNIWQERRTAFIANPKLSEYGFASAVDPWTAYQELSMFVGGVLPRQKQDTVEITDDRVIRDAKGHDDRSFKTASPGKKAGRRSRR